MAGKIGAGHASAMGRLGMRELRELGWFQNSNVAQPPEMGLYGTKTSGEIAAERDAQTMGHDSTEDRLGWPKSSQHEQQQEHVHEPEPEVEMGE